MVLSDWWMGFAVVLLAVLVLMQLTPYFRKGKRLPSPPGWPIIGNVCDMAPAVILESLARFRQELGGNFEISVVGIRGVVISDQELFRELQLKQPKLARRSKKFDFAAEALGVSSGLLFANGHTWSRGRRLVSPAFSKKNVDSMVCIIYSEVNEMVKKLTQDALNPTSTAPCNIAKELQLFTCSVVAKVAFGNEENMDYFCSGDFPDDLKHCFEFISNSNLFPLPMWMWRLSSYYRYEQQARTAMTRIEAACKEVIAHRKQLLLDETKREEGIANCSAPEPGLSSVNNSDVLGTAQRVKHRSLIDLLLRQGSVDDLTAITDSEILANTKIFFAAGTETTSVALSWCLFFLAQPQHRQILTDLRKEFASVFQAFLPHAAADHSASAKSPTSEELLNAYAQMRLGYAVFQESLRVKAPVSVLPISLYEPNSTVELSNGVILNSSDQILAYIDGSLMDPTVYPNPTEFIPSRWLTQDKDKLAQMEAAFLAFGSRPRVCPGQQLAYLEGVLSLGALAYNFDFELACPPSEIKRLMLLTSQPNKMPIHLYPRIQQVS